MKDELNQELTAARNFYFNVWKKHLEKKPLEPLEQQIVSIIEQHPEYHEFFENPEKQKTITNPSDLYQNPFLHISLHLSILEQLSINKPPGIKDIYRKLILKQKGAHNAEHIMMQCLQEMINESMAKGEEPKSELFLKLITKYC